MSIPYCFHLDSDVFRPSPPHARQLWPRRLAPSIALCELRLALCCHLTAIHLTNNPRYYSTAAQTLLFLERLAEAKPYAQYASDRLHDDPDPRQYLVKRPVGQRR